MIPKYKYCQIVHILGDERQYWKEGKKYLFQRNTLEFSYVKSSDEQFGRTSMKIAELFCSAEQQKRMFVWTLNGMNGWFVNLDG